jgi:hypothetical protein
LYRLLRRNASSGRNKRYKALAGLLLNGSTENLDADVTSGVKVNYEVFVVL